jgi:hypothetical protein
LQQSGVAQVHQALAHQEVAVAVHEKEGQAAGGIAHHLRAARVETGGRRVQVFADGVVAHPHFKQVAQDEDRVCGRGFKVMLPGREGGPVRGLQMQVRNEIDRTPGRRRQKLRHLGYGLWGVHRLD